MPGPNFISQAELDEIRGLQETLIDEIGGLGDIKRPTRIKDGKGGWTNSFSTQSNIPMRLWINSGDEGTSKETHFWGNQELSQTTAFITLAHDADIQIEDHVVFDNRNWKVVGFQHEDTFRTAIRVRVVALR